VSDHCHGDHCVTCSDEGVPMRVVELSGGLALCDDGASVREVMTELVGPVEPGDELLVHAGTAIARLA
jgi:hydrogenase assembly chaperone HypC/HupF